EIAADVEVAHDVCGRHLLLGDVVETVRLRQRRGSPSILSVAEVPVEVVDVQRSLEGPSTIQVVLPSVVRILEVLEHAELKCLGWIGSDALQELGRSLVLTTAVRKPPVVLQHVTITVELRDLASALELAGDEAE